MLCHMLLMLHAVGKNSNIMVVNSTNKNANLLSKPGKKTF